MHMSYEPYTSIIKEALNSRGSSSDDMLSHPEHRVPQYVVKLCDSLALAVSQVATSPVQLSQVLKLEGTCTGADYAEKLALRCQHLAVG
ncbi:hypothetical protein CX658_18380 [Pseudomonas amygdali pv. lachrymans]|nr:hypothetical protein CX658_18380 [Pseudomonas amygdali pv. lachrymans]